MPFFSAKWPAGFDQKQKMQAIESLLLSGIWE